MPSVVRKSAKKSLKCDSSELERIYRRPFTAQSRSFAYIGHSAWNSNPQSLLTSDPGPTHLFSPIVTQRTSYPDSYIKTPTNSFIYIYKL